MVVVQLAQLGMEEPLIMMPMEGLVASPVAVAVEDSTPMGRMVDLVAGVILF
jgi:hypothetical protein